MAEEPKESQFSDDFYYTIEFRIDKLSKQDLERVLNLIGELPTTKYKELSKLPKTQVDKTYM